MAVDSVADQLIANPAFIDASRSPLQFFVVQLHKRQAAETQLARRGKMDVQDYITINRPLLDQKKLAIAELQKIIASHTADTHSELLHSWLARREDEVALIGALIILHQSNDNPEQIEEVNHLCAQLYGSYNTDLFYHHLQLLLAQAAQNQNDPAWDFVTKHVVVPRHAAKIAAEPAKADFAYYKQLARQQFLAVEATVERHSIQDQHIFAGETLQTMVNELLQAIGATAQGWQAVLSTETTKIAVNYTKKTIYIREGHFRMMPYRLCGLLAHEVMVHVRRKLHATARQQLAIQASASEQAFEEGLGVFAEQVFLSGFRHLRQFRYVAIGLAKGSDGTPRTFRGVYELLWRLKYLAQQTGTEETARRYAFDETSRVFRGLPLHVRGAAFTKDKLYIEGNAAVWRSLSSKLTPDNFADFLFKR